MENWLTNLGHKFDYIVQSKTILWEARKSGYLWMLYVCRSSHGYCTSVSRAASSCDIVSTTISRTTLRIHPSNLPWKNQFLILLTGVHVRFLLTCCFTTASLPHLTLQPNGWKKTFSRQMQYFAQNNVKLLLLYAWTDRSLTWLLL